MEPWRLGAGRVLGVFICPTYSWLFRPLGVYELNVDQYGLHSDIATLYNTYVYAANSYSGPNLVSNFTWITPGTKDANGKLTMYQGLVTSNPVPEPSTIILLGTGMLFMAVYGKRRMNKEAL